MVSRPALQPMQIDSVRIGEGQLFGYQQDNAVS
jgi:hypothetical protein